MKFIIYLFIFNIFWGNSLSDTLIYDNKNLEDAILIPKYDNEGSLFKIEYLGKKRKLFLSTSLGYLNYNEKTIFKLSPLVNFRNLNFKIDLEYFFGNSKNKNINNDFTAMGFLEKIDYFNFRTHNENFKIHIGTIENLTFGRGYLLNRYSNNLNYPFNKNIGLKSTISNSSKTLTFKSFISNIENLFENGGLIGNHLSIIISDNIPLKLGFGQILDLNQFVDSKDQVDYERKVQAYQFDFDFPLFNILNRNVLIYGELSAIKFPETRYYKRIDDSEFTNDKKSRNGVWGILFPGFSYSINNYIFSLAFNYNSSIFNPKYFNTTYDFERIRYRKYDISNNEQNFSDEADLLMQFADDTLNQSGVYLPKDLIGMINYKENTYPTYGFSFNFERKVNQDNHLIIEYSIYKEVENIYSNLTFNDLYFKWNFNKKIFSKQTKINFIASKTFFDESDIFKIDENLIYGMNLDFNIYKSLHFILEYKNIFYDHDYDGNIDKNPYLNTLIKINL